MEAKYKKYILKSRNIFISIALIAILGFAIYSETLNGAFIWDDDLLVKSNIYIRKWSYITKIFTKDVGAGSVAEYNFYRPLQIVSYMIDYSLWRLNVIGYHLTNILLHIVAALGIYWLINLLYDDKILSLLTSIFFIAHPLHTEVVSYISSRTDLMAFVFILLSFILYVKYISSKDIRTYMLVLLSYICALLSRENSIILPVLILLYHYTFKKQFKINKFLPILYISFAYILLRFTFLKTLLSSAPTTTLFQRVPGFFVAITNYVRLLFLPFHLHMEYGNKLFSLTNPRAISGIFILFLSIFYAVRKRKDDNLISFSILWFFIALLPQSNLYPINANMAEHWIYMPSLGFFLILAKGVSTLYKKRKFKIIAILSIAGLLALYSYLTVRQNEYWREPISFYESTLKYAPRSSRIHCSLGIAYRELGKREKAIPLFEKAIEIKPDLRQAYNNLGITYRELGKTKKAISLFEKVIEINPDHAEAYNNLGAAYLDLGKREEAILLFEKAIEINPDYAMACYNLGRIYKTVGKTKKAIPLFEKVIKINPKYIEAHNSLGIVYYVTGRKQEGIISLKKAIEINPNYARAHNNLAVAYYNERKYELAIRHCDKAIGLGYEVDPEFLKKLKTHQK